MTRPIIPATALILILIALAGCNGNGGGEAKQDDAQVAASLNQGPRAAESMTLDPALASWGEQLFKDKACVTCHAVGERKQGPDLAGVADRRTERWLKRQIMDPEWMLKHDPIARGLMAEYALQMANQQVKDAEANALIQFLLRETLAGR